MPDTKGRVWYGTYEGGVCCRDPDGNWECFTTNDGLACNSVWGVWCDDDGTMWFTTCSGAQRLDLKAFQRGAPAAIKPPLRK